MTKQSNQRPQGKPKNIPTNTPVEKSSNIMPKYQTPPPPPPKKK